MTKTEFIQLRRTIRKSGAKNCPANQDQAAFELHENRIKKNNQSKNTGWHLLPVRIDDPEVVKIRDTFKRIRNWTNPRVDIANHGQYKTIDCGRYSGMCKYTRYEYVPIIRACCWLFPHSNKIAIRLYALPLLVLSAPRGWEFAADKNGICIRMKNNHTCNYHPFADEFQSKKISELCQIARDNYQTLQKIKRIEKLVKNIPDEQVIISIRDARKAGNCLAGIQNFMRAHNIHAKSIPAPVLRRIESSQPTRVLATIAIAKQRLAESLVNGFSPLYPI